MVPQSSLHAVIGTYSYQTMGIRGSKGTRALFFLIDFGNTHTFLDNKLAKQLGCVLEPIYALKDVCRHFQWGMQGYQFQAVFLILLLDNYDMILGIQELADLGDIVWNLGNCK